MSIVEKALSKLQETGKALGERKPMPDARPAPARPAQTEITQPQQVVAPTSHAAHPPRELIARNRISLNIEGMKAAGILPQEADALAMRNQFRRLKWPVFDEIASRRREGHACAGALMIASALPGEGKTFTSCNLALSMAREEGKRVVLIDCDIAKPQLSEIMGLRDKPGVTDFLSQPSLTVADILNATNIERLYFMAAGKHVAHVSELISSARMGQLLHELTSVDPGVVVLLDSSPVMATNEAQVLARLVPQILLVVRADKTPQPTVIEACDILGREKTAAVLNQAYVWSDAESYQAGYGYHTNERER